jgi:geranylgeranyl diphosphate synthase type II
VSTRPGVVARTVPGDLLAHYRGLVATEIGAILERSRGTELGGLAAVYPQRQGKGMRPALLLATCEAFGGTVDDALPAAVSLELMHNAFLVHDDVEDSSPRRRGDPTLHTLHGVPMAVHAGDMLAVNAILPLLDQPRLSTRLVRRVTREFLEAANHTLEGQSMELRWREDVDRRFGLDDYLRLVLHKSCWYSTIYPLRAGYLIGSRSTAALGPLSTFGFLLGAAFQIRDDVLSLTGDPETHGKVALDDLHEAKRTLPLAHVLEHASPSESAWLSTYLGKAPDERSDADLATVLALMHEHGSIDAATASAYGLAAGARSVFGVAFGDAVSPDHARFVGELVNFVVDRDG